MDVAYRGLKDTSACFCFVDSSLALNDINEACFDKRWQSDSVASQNDDVLFQRSRRGPQAGKTVRQATRLLVWGHNLAQWQEKLGIAA